MTAKQGREVLREHKLGVLLVGMGIVGYAASFYVDDWRGKIDWAYAASVAGGLWQMVEQRRQKKSVAAVSEGVKEGVKDGISQALSQEVHELTMAVVRLSGNVDGLRSDVTASTRENNRQHAEHVKVTDSLANGIAALSGAVSKVVPGFTAPVIEQRQDANATP